MKRIRARAEEALGIPKAEIRGVYVVASVSAAAPWGREGGERGGGGEGVQAEGARRPGRLLGELGVACRVV